MTTQTNPDTIDGVDFDSCPCCEMVEHETRLPFCDSPADWVMTTRCCGKAFLSCDPHLQTFMAYVKGRKGICLLCPKKWTDIAEQYSCIRL